VSENLYDILGVAKTATQDEIKKSYRRLAKKYHPDVAKNDPGAEEKFKKIAVAYEVLNNPEKRKIYDEFGLDGLREGFNPDAARAAGWRPGAGPGQGDAAQWGGFQSNINLNDIFEELFGRSGFGRSRGGPFQGFNVAFNMGDLQDLEGFGRAGRQPRQRPGRAGVRGNDVRTELSVELLDAVRGVEIPLTLEIPSVCPACEGIGVEHRGGSCRSCHGTGQVRGSERNIKVRIPAGIENGKTIRLAGLGSPGTGGGPAGDLFIEVHVKPHPFLKQEAQNLLMDLPVTPAEAYKGAKVEVPTPWGPVQMKIPAGSQSGAQLRLRGKGAGKKGDLIVRLMITLPVGKDEKIEKALDEVESRYLVNVRSNIRL